MMLALRAARAWGAPPMEYLGLEPPGSPWSLKSRGLAQGLMLHEDGTNRHGIPVHVAQNPENAGFFEVDDSLVDHAEAAYERWQKDNKESEPGVLPVVRLDGRALAAAKARRAARKPPPAAPAPAAEDRPLS